ncbi:hypothetical protein CEXT_299651 [Caerostris extrusa]|uniref:Transmembrane protein n=1 Tax=Caerostris extrusa TaxID=172846 RepID=A0AAV4PUK1_CAEEX|nr:hypothetical protein CEXT_299651 [Caerostris extrusa]
MEWVQRIGSLDESRQYPRIVDIEDISCQLSFNRLKTTVSIVHAHSSQFLCRYKSHCFALCHCCANSMLAIVKNEYAQKTVRVFMIRVGTLILLIVALKIIFLFLVGFQWM